jgi:hypothetical protein
MQDKTASHGPTHGLVAIDERGAAPSVRAWVTLIGAATLSAMLLHMAKSTTAADRSNPMAQHSTLPIDA